MASLRRRDVAADPPKVPVAFERYETRPPSPQTAIDAVPGWNSIVPAAIGVTAGTYPLFEDDRIGWLIREVEPLAGTHVLEIGPMEAGHTTMLHRAGATITAVEASKSAFVKCLITKELLDLQRARFLLGDCVPFLEQGGPRYGLLVASGVLYHMPDPLRFLTAAAARTDTLFLWTSFIDEAGDDPGGSTAQGFAALRETRRFGDMDVVLYRMGYQGVHVHPEFCGGIYDAPLWMDRASILGVLRHLGFDSVTISHENRSLPHHPSFSVLARRSRPST